jgi:hypothetical protein
MTATQSTISPPSRLRAGRTLASLFGCVAALAALTACGGTAPTASAVGLENLPPVDSVLVPITHTYSVESFELIEMTRFEDGSLKYMPTGWIVGASRAPNVGGQPAQP